MTTKTVRRFDVVTVHKDYTGSYGSMEQSAEGEYVLYSEYETLRRALKELVVWQNREFTHLKGCASLDDEPVSCDCGYQKAVDDAIQLLATLEEKS